MKSITAFHVTDHGTILSYNGELKSQQFDITKISEYCPDNSFYVFYSLNQSTACILKSLNLPKEQLRLLNKGQIIYYKNVSLSFMAYKYLKIKEKGTVYTFSDMSQFYDATYDPNEDLTAKVKQAFDTATAIYKQALKMNLNPLNLTSPINMFSRSILGHEDAKGNSKPLGVDIPTVADLPDEFKDDLSWYAYQSCHGGWTEAYKKGHFDVWDLDLNSAYPYIMSTLMDTRYGTWTRGQYQPEAKYGFALCDAEINAKFHPIMVKSNKLQVTPTGRRTQPLGKGKIDLIYQYPKIGTIHKILDGFWWTPKFNKYPLYTVMAWLGNEKQKTDGLAKTFVKRISTGISGKLIEIYKDGKPGDNLNPVWRAIVEEETQLILAKYIIKNGLEDHVLYIATDGILLDCPPVNLILSNRMGGWKLSHKSKALVVSSGLVAVQGKTGQGAFSIDYDYLMNAIKDNPQSSTYAMNKYSVMTLGKALQENKIDELGNTFVQERSLDITYEAKRFFDDVLTCGNDLLTKKLNSYPLSMSHAVELIEQ
jgi:hypothetical protein